MWALVLDGVLVVTRDELPGEIMVDRVAGVAPEMTVVDASNAAVHGWVAVTFTDSPGPGFVPLMVLDGAAVVQTWVEV